MDYRVEIIEPGKSTLPTKFQGAIKNNDEEVAIYFFDTDHEQFVSSYYVSTLTEDRERLSDNGLCLDGGVEKWSLTGDQMKEVFVIIDEFYSEEDEEVTNDINF